jgi:hypothetical protein
LNIYTDEKPIEQEILAARRVTSVLQARVVHNDSVPAALVASFDRIFANEKDQKSKRDKLMAMNGTDLIYGSAILASTCMNDNDEIFTPEETWAAKNTPIDQPYNYMHERTKIIGHIIDARTLDSDGVRVDEMPEFFDIEVDFVLYSSVYPEFANEFALQAEAGERFVSMECFINDFDYGLIQEDGSVTIVARNKETAFLTKSLRRFGGDGTYNGQRIGRVIKGIRFVGMGDVDVPANKRSVYTSLFGKNLRKLEECEIAACICNLKAQRIAASSGDSLTQGKETMSDTTVDTKELETQVATLTAEKATVAGELEVATEKLSTVEATVTALKTEIETLKAEIQTVTEAKAIVDAELNTIKAAKIGTDRIAELTALGKTFEDIEAATAKYSKMSNEAYDEIVEFVKSHKAPATPATTDANDDPDNQLNKATPDATIGELPADEDPDPVGDLSTAITAALDAKSKAKKVTRPKKG